MSDSGVIGYLREILEELRLGPRGETWPATVTVPATAVLTIDFEDGKAKLSQPLDVFTQIVNIPQTKLFALTITNDGPNLVQYSTNKNISSKDADAALRVGETVPLNFLKPCVTRLHLIAIGGPSTVRIVGLI
jgi:hypothetical protein